MRRFERGDAPVPACADDDDDDIYESGGLEESVDTLNEAFVAADEDEEMNDGIYEEVDDEFDSSFFAEPPVASSSAQAAHSAITQDRTLSPSSAGHSALEPFSVGQQVEARYHAMSTWYGGVIVAAHSDGCYDILFCDGDEEANVPSELIRKAD